MLLRLQALAGPAAADRQPPVTGDDDARARPGFLGRIGGWNDAGDEFLSISLWHSEAEPLPGAAANETWHCVQDLGGIYDGLSVALLSANALLLMERRIADEQQNLLQRLQRQRALPALASQAAFLCGALAARPVEPGRFLELSLWQSRAEAESFLLGPVPALEDQLLADGLQTASHRSVLHNVLRRHTLEAEDTD